MNYYAFDLVMPTLETVDVIAEAIDTIVATGDLERIVLHRERLGRFIRTAESGSQLHQALIAFDVKLDREKTRLIGARAARERQFERSHCFVLPH